MGQGGAPRADEAARAGAAEGPARDDPAAFAEFYAADPTYGRFPQERRRAGSVPVEWMRVEQGEVDAVDPALPVIVLAMNLGCVQGFEARFDCGDGWFGGPMREGTLLVPPPDAALHCKLSAAHTVLVAPLPLAPLARALGREPAAMARAIEPLHRDLHHDPLIGELMRACWREAARSDPASVLLIDQGTLALGAALLARAGAEADRLPPRLDDRRMQRAADYAEANLERTITLGDLAAVACLSPWHFNRAFKRATGRTPAAYVQARRVARARRLLADPAMPLAEVAHAAGFASQSHFGEVFRRHVGASPGAYRAGTGA